MNNTRIEPEINNQEVNAGDESSLIQTTSKETERIMQNEENNKMSFVKKLKLIKDNITVEPIVIGFVVARMLPSLAVQNLYLEKACRVNLNYSDEVCDALTARQTDNYTIEEQEVQKITATVAMWKNIIQTVFPVMIMLFIGAWSDKTGKRKAIMLLPIAAEAVSTFGLMLNTYFFKIPLEVTAFTDVIFPSLVGGTSTHTIGVFSYIGDITTVEERTFRVGVLTMCTTLGYPIGTAMSGLLFKWMGYYGVFSVSLSMLLLCVIYGLICIKDPRRRAENQIEIDEHDRKGFVREFFDITLVADTFKVILKKGPGNRRLLICLILVIMIVVYGPMIGEGTVTYLFVRYKFRWTDVQFSLWSTYGIVTSLIGSVLSIAVFIKLLKLNDALLGIIANISKITGAFAHAFAMNTWQMYLAPTINMFGSVSYVAIQSIATKIVDAKEFGKLNSLFGLIEVVVPLGYGPLYAWVYMNTIDVFPGAFFLLGAVLTLPAFAIFSWMYIQHKRGRLQSEEKTEDIENQTDQEVI